MRFCDSCGSMMRTEGDSWVCGSCGNDEPRDSEADAAMTTQDEQRVDGAPPVVDGTQDASETVEAHCPADGYDSDRASYEMRPKPGGSYVVRVFTCVEYGHTWHEN
ncbi:MAG: RPA12/RPB9/RPC11 RNA polymerase family protein [Halanaeroarchaeum sp.]